MSDLIERLRQSAALPNGLYAEAADRIEALEAKLAVAREALGGIASCEKRGRLCI